MLHPTVWVYEIQTLQILPISIQLWSPLSNVVSLLVSRTMANPALCETAPQVGPICMSLKVILYLHRLLALVR